MAEAHNFILKMLQAHKGACEAKRKAGNPLNYPNKNNILISRRLQYVEHTDDVQRIKFTKLPRSICKPDEDKRNVGQIRNVLTSLEWKQEDDVTKGSRRSVVLG